MDNEMVGLWRLRAMATRTGELGPDDRPQWGRTKELGGSAVPTITLALHQDGRFAHQDEEPFEKSEPLLFDGSGALSAVGAGRTSFEAFWRTTNAGDVDEGGGWAAYVVATRDSTSNKRRPDFPAITETLRLDGSTLVRRVLSVTDGIYLDEQILSYEAAPRETATDAQKGASAWLLERAKELSEAGKPEALPALMEAAPALANEAVKQCRAEERSDTMVEALLALRGEVDRIVFMRGHKKKAETYAWALDAAGKFDALLSELDSAFVSPNLVKMKLDSGLAAQLLRHGHHDAVALWADKLLAKKAKKRNYAALIVGTAADLSRGEVEAARGRLATVEPADMSRNLKALEVCALALAADAEGALAERLVLTKLGDDDLQQNDFEHRTTMFRPLVGQIERHAATQVDESGDPHLAALLFTEASKLHRFTRLSVNIDGQLNLPMVQDENGEYLLARWDEKPVGLMPTPRKQAPDPIELVFGDTERPERYLLWALAIQAAHAKRMHQKEAVKVFRSVIQAKDPSMLAR